MNKDIKALAFISVVVTCCFCLIGALIGYSVQKQKESALFQQTERTKYCQQLELKDDALWNCIKNV